MGLLRNSSAEPRYLGYSAVGIVERVGCDVSGIHEGQRVACYGAPYVRHAEFLSVPSNLIAPVPDSVPAEEAAFVGLGTIAVHALRVADLKFGESVVVVGLGLFGNLISQIATAASFRTFGYDLNAERVALLQQCGVRHACDTVEKLEASIVEGSPLNGVDCVILCAAGPGELLINQALTWLMDKGKVVIVGDIAPSFSRELMFRKEASVLISRAGGPGRYDENYEKKNQDYPIGFVR